MFVRLFSPGYAFIQRKLHTELNGGIEWMIFLLQLCFLDISQINILLIECKKHINTLHDEVLIEI